jgi:serine/threonine-protein kinase
VTPPDTLLDDVADAVLDGTPIDWSEVDSRAGADRALLDELKALAGLRLARQASGSSLHDSPQRWGHLRVLERIGIGAFGEVYRAWETSLDREVALKLLRTPGRDGGPPTVIEEGRLLARVRHPNVVTIHGAERIDGRVGLWMEFIRGRTLEQLLREGRRFTAAEVARIGSELCGAVSAVHSAGLVHRDIKAQNVMMADDGRLVLMDFGTGLELRNGHDVPIAGTPLYLAPEVLTGGPATVRSDVYSIGVLLYRLLTNQFPVHAHDLAGLRGAHGRGERNSLSSARPDVPQRFVRVVERALNPAPGNRFENAESFREALESLRRVSPLRWAAYATAAALVVAAGLWYSGVLNARAPAARRSVASPVALGTIPSPPMAIAVLPFRNLSSTPDTGHFADGLTEEITRNLTAIPGLQLRSQTSSAHFKEEPHNVARIGERLRVNLIVTGSVQRDGRKLRVAAQLVSVDGDVLLWSERYDRTLEEVFAVQDEISRAVAAKLNLTLSRPLPAHRPPVDTYELYLQARAKLVAIRTEAAREAVRLFEEVIARDPAYAPAYAGLADAYAFMSWQIPGLSPQEGLRRMRPAAEKAIELDPSLAEAHAAMGMTHARALDWESARQSFERAIALNPSLTYIQTNYVTSTLLQLGEVNRAIQMLEAALVTDPMSPEVRRELAFAQVVAGRYEEALSHLRQAAVVDSGTRVSNLQLARALTFSGRAQEAVALWENRGESEPDWERWLTHAYVRLGRHDDVARLVKANGNDHPYRQALVYSAVGDVDRTFAALSEAVDLMPQRTALLLVLPEMSLLKGDSRLRALQKRLRLP